MENVLQKRLDAIFEINKKDRNIVFLKSLGLDKIMNFTNEIVSIHNKQSELSAKNRVLMSRIYVNLYRTVQSEKERQELDNGSEGAEGVIIKTK
jgi:hypothetical protein